MNAHWNHDLAIQHGDALRKDAQHARLAREARASGGSAHHGRSPARRRRLMMAATTGALAAAAASYSIASAASPPPVSTPNRCIQVNGGDYNACNVGNSGRGDLPYRPVSP
jgi:hypothetical protein